MKIRMGDTIVFRGRNRFVVLADGGALTLEKVRASGPRSTITHYTVGPGELAAIRVFARGDARDRARARKLYEGDCLEHTRIEWSDDDWPTFVHRVDGEDHRVERRRRQ